MKPSGVGFLLLDSSLKVLYASNEAVRIFTYPGSSRPSTRDSLVGRKVRLQLVRHLPSLGSPSLSHLRSGKRRYLCRAFALGPDSNAPSRTGSFQPTVAVLIERSDRVRLELARLAQQYHLTERERQSMELVMHGLTTKEIAARMSISPNTVKAFLRLLMLKMGVSTRSGIVGKLIATER